MSPIVPSRTRDRVGTKSWGVITTDANGQQIGSKSVAGDVPSVAEAHPLIIDARFLQIDANLREKVRTLIRMQPYTLQRE